MKSCKKPKSCKDLQKATKSCKKGDSGAIEQLKKYHNRLDPKLKNLRRSWQFRHRSVTKLQKNV